jgi:hypothetical protein
MKNVDFGGHKLNFKQYLAIQTSYTRGRFWHSESAGGGFWLTEKGISKAGLIKVDDDSRTRFDLSKKPSDAWATFHTHPFEEYEAENRYLFHSQPDIENMYKIGVPIMIINKYGIEYYPLDNYHINCMDMNMWTYDKPFNFSLLW